MFKSKLFILIIIMLSIEMTISAQKIALLKYKGGGDWYANITTSLPNLIKFANENIHTTRPSFGNTQKRIVRCCSGASLCGRPSFPA
jgi:oligoribonuclease NrnB/cAMP/cGMP phosphodiesterase (DHH superfamily)